MTTNYFSLDGEETTIGDREVGEGSIYSSSSLRTNSIGESWSTVPNNTSNLVTSRISELENRRMTLQDIPSDLFFTPIDYDFISARTSYTGTQSLNRDNLVFLEMRMENKDDKVLLHMIYINKETYEEVTRTYNCSISITNKYNDSRRWLNSDTITGIRMDLDGMETYKETRKPI